MTQFSVTHLLGTAFETDTFGTQGLSNAEQACELEINGPHDSTQLKWKPEML